MDVFESTLYWASQQTGKLMTMDKFGRGVNVTLQAGLLLPSSLKIFHPLRHNMTGNVVVNFFYDGLSVTTINGLNGLINVETIKE